ncbi:MAG: TetR family transcriptional regulator [Bacilli bacterium]|nr:TetR family transcriptional regulator [Bacilli bacterium]
MPPIVKYNREGIISASYEIAQKEGMDSINARRIAKELNCSVQPIFHNFTNMKELKKAVYDKIYQTYLEYMRKGSEEEQAYKGMGLAYINFAKYYPEFFKILFMQKTTLNAENFILADDQGDEVIRKGQTLTGLNFESQKKFHVKVWIFTHGIACLVATQTIKISDKEIEELLKTTVMEMVKGYKLRNEERK